MATKNRYNIIRDDLLTDPITVITEGLLIGRLLQCELVLNHPAVSRVQAGIKQVDDDYYVFPLRPSNPVKLNGRPVVENEALAVGDLLDVGPFHVEIDDTDEALVLKVSLRIGMTASEIDASSAGLSTDNLVVPEPGKKPAKPRAKPLPATKALDIFWDKRIREAGKMVRPSPLFPKSQRRSGKAQFTWMPTTDLKSHWPVSFFVWAAVLVGLVSLAAAYWYTSAYSPAPLSKVHSVNQLSVVPAIAARPNAGACTSCHSWKRNMEERCAECHHTNAFVATEIKPHEAAGIGCAQCHGEHRGAEFRPIQADLASCTNCHSDNNAKTYNGKRVGTPHGGTFGYPVVNGKWNPKTIDNDEWALKKNAVTRLPTDTDDKWISKQFHWLHSERVKVVPGIPGNALGQLSCSSCHTSFTGNVDRVTPRTRCGVCHNGSVEAGTNRVLIAADKPNCVSCHVQHIQDAHRWGTSLLAQK